MEKRVKKMKRFAVVTLQLYEELEILSELENSLTRMQDNNTNQVKLNEFKKKVMWQREEVGGLREMSVWIQTYDYVVRLLLRSLFTIVERVKVVFGITRSRTGSSDLADGRCFVRTSSVSAPSVYPSESSIPRSVSNLGYKAIKKVQARYSPPIIPRSMARMGPLRRCMRSDATCSPRVVNGLFQSAYTVSDSKKRLSNGQNPTVGDAALALHYANVIVYIERLAMSPHFISPHAREDLYHMLTTRIKNSLRSKISFLSKTDGSKVYNRDLASDWSSSMQETLDWLAPLAHNMIKWHSERKIEMQHMGSGGSVLLVTTLHYADQVKCEDAITELVMGIHYVSRFGREVNEKAFMGTDGDDDLLHQHNMATHD